MNPVQMSWYIGSEPIHRIHVHLVFSLGTSLSMSIPSISIWLDFFLLFPPSVCCECMLCAFANCCPLNTGSVHDLGLAPKDFFKICFLKPSSFWQMLIPRIKIRGKNPLSTVTASRGKIHPGWKDLEMHRS